MGRTIVVDPITRLEGHAKLRSCSTMRSARFFQVPELRGFEAFCVGRPAEDMPQITSRICGVCPTAHHMAATKALDDLFGVTPPPAAAVIRELFYTMFTFEDHLVHFYIWAGRTSWWARMPRPGNAMCWALSAGSGSRRRSRCLQSGGAPAR